MSLSPCRRERTLTIVTRGSQVKNLETAESGWNFSISAMRLLQMKSSKNLFIGIFYVQLSPGMLVLMIL